MRLLIVHLRIRHALCSGVSVRPGINKNTPKGVFVYSGWGARIRTMIKRTKISCPTIRRHPNCVNDYKHLLINCNNNFIALDFYTLFYLVSDLGHYQIQSDCVCGYYDELKIHIAVPYTAPDPWAIKMQFDDHVLY